MQKVHFIGICGAGMSAVAKLLIEKGVTVSGSDEGFYPPISDYLVDNNIPFIKGYNRENIVDGIDTVVIGKHAKLTPEENEEVAYAFQMQKEDKLKVYSFPEILRAITKDRENILCVGSFGKSTTTSLMAHLLESAGRDVGYFIGAAPFTPSSNAHIGTHKNFILEGDEYPSSNWDDRSKFLHLNAHDVLLTALSHDHVNIFKTHAEYKQTFFNLIKQIPVDGQLVVCLDEKNLVDELENIKSLKNNLVTYSLESKDADYYADNIVFGEVTTFDLYSQGLNLGSFETTLLGKHNLQNIVGVCAMILEKELLNIDEIKNGLKTFRGVKRRLDLLTSEDKEIKVYEGFGSSYDKARAAIDAIRLHYPDKKLVIVFEPHTFSWRNIDAVAWYDDVFKEARLVFVYAPPSHGATTHTQLTQNQIIERIVLSNEQQNRTQQVFSISDKENGMKTILNNLNQDTDIVLILSSGDMDGIIKELPSLV